MPKTTKQDEIEELSRWATLGLPALPMRLRVLVITILMTTLVALALSIMIKVPELREVRGVVVATGAVADVKTSRQGVVDQIFVSVGDIVEKGEPIIRIFAGTSHLSAGDGNDAEIKRLDITAQRIEAQQAELSDEMIAIRQAQEQYRVVTEEKIALHQKIIANLGHTMRLRRAELERIASLRKKDLASQRAQETAEMQLLSEEQNLLRVRINVVDMTDSLAQSLENTRQKLASLSQELSDLDLEKKKITIELQKIEAGETITLVAPITGRVTKILPKLGTSIGFDAGLLAQITAGDDNTEPFMIEFYSASNTLKGLAVGQNARVALDSYDVNAWGTLPVTLAEISASSYAPQELPEGLGIDQSLFRIRTKFSSDDPFFKEQPAQLRPGMTATGYFVVAERRLISWLIDPLEKAITILLRISHIKDTS